MIDPNPRFEGFEESLYPLLDREPQGKPLTLLSLSHSIYKPVMADLATDMLGIHPAIPLVTNIAGDLLKYRTNEICGDEGLRPQKVVLRFKKTIANIVAERAWHPTQKITRHRNGTLTLEMKTIISDELRSWVGSWLQYVKVIQPKNLLSTSDRVKA